MQRRRQRALRYLGGACAHCGTTEDLEFDHIDPAAKTYAISGLLSSKWERVVEELNKCQLLCQVCHVKKTEMDGSHARGEGHGNVKLTVSDVLAIRNAAQAGELQRVIAFQYSMHQRTISKIVRREKWKHV